MNDSLTVHKALSLSVRNDFKTGKTFTTTTTRTKDLGGVLFVVDEASMIDPIIMDIIDNHTTQAKVIYVGDEHQLAPVGSTKIPVFNQGWEEAILTEPMRQDKNSHLFKELCKLREGVIEQEVYLPKQGKGITDVDAQTFKDEILKAKRNDEDFRVLAFTNKQVENYNKFVRKHTHTSEEFCEGDLVVAANCCNETSKVEETYKICSIGSEYTHETGIRVRTVTLDDNNAYPIPVNKSAWFKEIKLAEAEGKESGHWQRYFQLKNGILDIRDAYACTAHKSQGSTYEKVFVDLQNMLACKQIDTLVRMLYVAFSRAKTEVIVYRG